MADKIKVRAGLAADRPVLDIREPGFDTDLRKLWLGSSIGNVQVVMAAPTAETWIAPTLLNSWVNLGTGYFTAGYYKDDLNIVRIRGLIKSGVTASTTQLFVLPAGYRPSLLEMKGCFSSTAGTITTSIIEINTGGSVYLSGGTAGNTYLVLDFTFRAEL